MTYHRPRMPRRRKDMDTVQIMAYVRPEVRERIYDLSHENSLPMWAIIEAAVMYGIENGAEIPEGWDLDAIYQQLYLPENRGQKVAA